MLNSLTDPSRTARDKISGRAKSPAGVLVADHEGGGDREQQDAGGQDEDESRHVMIEEQAEEGRWHGGAEIEARIDKAKDRARGAGRSRAAHQHVARRSGATPSEPCGGDTRD